MTGGVLAFLPALAWAAILLLLGSRPDPPSLSPDLPIDKVAHFLLYGVLGVLAAAGWYRSTPRPHVTLPLALALLVGVFDELNQLGVPGRSADLRDWCADAAGIAAGFAWLHLRRASPETSSPR